MESDIGSQDDEQFGGTYLSLRAEGNICYLRGKYYDAIEFFTRALDTQNSGHTDCDLFIRRGWCHLQLANTNAAFLDITEAQMDVAKLPKAAERLALLRAEVLYATGKFEKALVHFSRGKVMKPSDHRFVLGINKCREAISNCVGGPERIKLSLLGDLSHFRKSTEKLGMMSRPLSVKQMYQHGAASKEELPNEKTIQQLLAEIYDDKIFLEKLSAEAGCKKMDYDSNSTEALDETLLYLNRRTLFWQKQNPIYSQTYEKYMCKRCHPCAINNCNYLDKFLSKELEKVQIDIANGNLTPGLRRATRCLSMVKNMDRIMPINRDAFSADVHGLIGNICFEANQLRRAQKHYIKAKVLAMKSGVTSCQMRALENLAKVYIRQHDYQNTVEQWIPKLDIADNAEERAWLCHDIGRCYMELEQYTQVLEYGAKALLEATDATDKQILLSIKVLIAQAHAKEADYVAAREVYGTALALAQNLGTKTTEVLIQEALEKVSQCIEAARSAIDTSAPHHSVSVIVSKPAVVTVISSS